MTNSIGKPEVWIKIFFITALFLTFFISGKASVAYALEIQCTLLKENGKCCCVILRGPIRAEPKPGQAAPQWTRDNPFIPKTQSDLNNLPPGSIIKDPKTGNLFIQAGDYEKVQKFLRTNWPALEEIALMSDGGNAYEAMKIGRLIRKYLITTYVPGPVSTRCGSTGCVCASACALIWFGGIQRMGVVGLHRPRVDDPDFANQPPEEATKLYRGVLRAMENYLEEMEVPQPTIQVMVATSSSEIHWVDAIGDQLSRPPSYAEWEDASCHEKFNPEQGPIFSDDPCRYLLRSSRRKLLSAPD